MTRAAPQSRLPRLRCPGARLLAALALCVALLLPTATATPDDEAEAHAAYIINFMRYARWPDAGGDTPYVVATLGTPQSAAALRALARRVGAIDGHPVEVRALSFDSGVPSRARAIAALQDAIDGASVLYVPASHAGWDTAAVAAVAGRPVLTVGTGAAFLEAGGMFALFEDGGRVRFGASEPAIRRSGIEVSARVLVLARTVPARGDDE